MGTTLVQRYPAPFVIGMPDSGVELLRLMLDAHEELAIPGPTFFVPKCLTIPHDCEDISGSIVTALTSAETWADHSVPADIVAKGGAGGPSDAVRAFYETYAARFAKQRWGDSTPRYGYHITEIASAFPEAHFIHVVRDGRDAAVMCKKSHGWRGFLSIEGHAQEWAQRYTVFSSAGRNAAHYLEIRYEELITYTPQVLRVVCNFLRLPFSPSMFLYYRRVHERLQEMADIVRPYGKVTRSERIQGTYAEILARACDSGRWRYELTASERAQYEAIAGGTLAALGYTTTVHGVHTSDA